MNLQKGTLSRRLLFVLVAAAAAACLILASIFILVWMRPRTLEADLKTLKSLTPIVRVGRLYFDDEQETRRGCCDSPNATITRAYVVDCAERHQTIEAFEAELIAQGFPHSMKFVFSGTDSESWRTALSLPQVTGGRVNLYYSLYAGARLPVQVGRDVDATIVRDGCTFQFLISVGQP